MEVGTGLDGDDHIEVVDHEKGRKPESPFVLAQEGTAGRTQRNEPTVERGEPKGRSISDDHSGEARRAFLSSLIEKRLVRVIFENVGPSLGSLAGKGAP